MTGLVATRRRDGGSAPLVRRLWPDGAAGVIDRARFWLYRNLIAVAEWDSFRRARIVPLILPVDENVTFRPFSQAHPRLPLRGLYEVVTPPAERGARRRLRRSRVEGIVLSLLKKIAPRHTPPIPADLESYLSVVYPFGFRRAWPVPPVVPAELAPSGADLLAELAVRAPFGSYLRRSVSETGEDSYEIDLTWMARYQVRDSLVRPGGRARFRVHERRLTTTSVEHDDAVPPELARAALLAGLNESLTTFRHNLFVHLTMVNSFALATSNQLGARHPVRRLLHHCFHTVLVGNREVGELQLGGPTAFAATIFSHDSAELVRMVSDRLRAFDFWDFEPDTQFGRRGTLRTPFGYPYRDNVLRLWAETKAYVEEYLRLYYGDDDAVGADPELARWIRELDTLMPNGVTRSEEPCGLRWLTRLCATLIHVSTVEHDIVNNIVWNYSTLGWIVPTVVPSSGERMDQRRAFDLVATLIGTWKPYNMLLDAEILTLALDPAAEAVMQKWLFRLRRVQGEMDAKPADPSLSYPAKLNISISN